LAVPSVELLYMTERSLMRIGVTIPELGARITPAEPAAKPPVEASAA
jgi:hypothetical protein